MFVMAKGVITGGGVSELAAASAASERPTPLSRSCAGSSLRAFVTSPVPENTEIVYFVTIANIGKDSCILPTAPAKIALLGGSGGILAIRWSGSTPVLHVPRWSRVLASGGTNRALTIVSWVNWCGELQDVSGVQVWLHSSGPKIEAHLPASSIHLIPGCDADSPSTWTVGDSGVMATNYEAWSPPRR
jgi:hypothetical protein